MGFDRIEVLVRAVAKRILARAGLEVHRIGRQNDQAGLKLPQVELATLLDGRVPVAVSEIDAVDGNTSLPELLVLATLVRRCKPGRMFEIGTFDGRTSVNLVSNAPADAELLTLDLPPHTTRTAMPLDVAEEKYTPRGHNGRRFIQTRWKSRITQLYGDSATFDFTPYESSCDFVFVDGSHTYDYARNDSEVALRLVSPGGTIVWHDYQPFWTGVVRYLNELSLTSPQGHRLRHVAGTSLVVLGGDDD